jgi:hypothetical protein
MDVPIRKGGRRPSQEGIAARWCIWRDCRCVMHACVVHTIWRMSIKSKIQNIKENESHISCDISLFILGSGEGKGEREK